MKKPFLKYCGLSKKSDLEATYGTQATYIGFVFVKQSRRYVDPKQVEQWLKEIPLHKTKKLVGVFQNESLHNVSYVESLLPLTVLQLHGDESVEYISALKEITKALIWKAIPYSEKTVLDIQTYAPICDGIVVDTKTKAGFGGTGQSFPWKTLPSLIKACSDYGKLLIVAGGIHSGNLSELLSFPIGCMDISSGIETNGQKDVIKINRIEEVYTHAISR